MPTTPINVRSAETEAVTVFKFINIYDPTTKPPKLEGEITAIKDEAPEESVFSEAVDGITDHDAKEDALVTAIEGFTPITTTAGVKAINPGLYTLGGKLPTFRPKTSPARLQGWLNGLTPLDSTDLRTVWDNIYYYALTAKSVQMAEAFFALLRANALLLEYTEQQANPPADSEEADRYWNRLLRVAGGRIIIPQELVELPKADSPLEKDDPNLLDPHAESQMALNRMTEVAIAKEKIELLNKAIAELRCADTPTCAKMPRNLRMTIKTTLTA